MRVAGALGVLALFGLVPAAARADRAFTPRFSANDTGNVTIAGAPLMTCSTTGTHGAACAGARNADASSGPLGSASNSGQNNNSYTMVPVDTDGDPTTTVNSSTATLSLPAGATVLFAGLYWGGDDVAGTNGGDVPPPGTPSDDQVKLKPPGGAYRTLTATALDSGTGIQASRYQGFVDVTDEVADAGAGTYAVGDVRAGTGGDRYAGWSLVVAYRDTTQPARNLTVFDGLRSVATNTPATIPVSGFRTPAAGAVRTTLGFIAYDGDLGLGGDTATLNTTTLSNAANQATNFFNGSVSAGGVAVTTRDPAFRNTLGFDADMLNADGVLANGATDATIRLTTRNDQYLPGVVTFATQLYAPAVALNKAVANVTHPRGPDQRGDVLRYTLTAHNAGQDGADDFVLGDPLPAGVTFVPGSLLIGGAAASDAGGDDAAEYVAASDRVVYRLAAGASATLGGRLAAGASATVSFDVRIDDVAPRFEIVNAASATFVAQSLRAPLAADSNPVTDVVAAPDLTLAKSHAPEFVRGAETTFRLVVSNVGNLAGDGSPVTVTDTLPPAFSALGAVGGDGWSCSTGGLSLTCSRSDALADGASFPPILVDATVAADAPDAIVNTAQVAGGGDANPANNSATDVGGSAEAADLQITKTAAPGSVLSGDAVRFTLTVLNAGPSTARAVTVSDPLGADYDAVGASASAGTCTAAVDCALGDLARGESATITIDATVTANATTLTNTATVGSPTPDPAPANNTASATVDVAPTADLRLTKTPSTPTPAPGAVDGLTYTIVAANAGPSAATGVVISDGIPADFSPTAITAPPGFSCSTVGATIACTGGTIAAGDSATLTVTGTVAASPASPTLTNTAQVRADTGDPNLTDNAATATVQAQPLADIAVTKDWGGAADPFRTLTSTDPDTDVRARLTIANLGPSPATSVVLRDPLPAGATFVSADRAECASASNVVTCNVGALAPGASFTALVRVHVAAGAAGTTLVNTASGSADQPDPVASDDRSSARLAVGTAADLALQKTASVAAASVGDRVTFTLTVTDDGPNDAADVTITDALPPGLSFDSSADCSAAGRTVTCASGPLAVGATRTQRFVALVGRAAAGTIAANVAAVTSTTQDPLRANNRDAASVTIAPQTDLSVVKTASDPTPQVDQDVTYTLTAANHGPNDATGVVVTDAVAAGMAFVDAPGCSFDAAASTVTCTIGDLASGASAEQTVTLRPQVAVAGQRVPNTAIVTGDQPDPVAANNTSVADVDVAAEADLAIVKTANGPTVVAGGSLTYTLVVSNAGPSTAPAVTVDDPLPAGATAVDATASQGSCTVAADHVRCTLGALASGGQAQVAIDVGVDAGAGGTLDNAATVDGGVFDPRLEDNRSSVLIPVTTIPGPQPAPPSQIGPQLTIAKTADKTSASTSDAVTFRLTVDNHGTAAATDVVVTDTFSRAVTLLSVTPSLGTCTRAPLVCRIDTLAAGGEAVITIVARATTAGQLINGAGVTAGNAPGAAATPVAVQVVTARTSLSLRKRASRARVTAGGRVRYALTVRNAGANAALAVRVCDRLPSGLTFASAPHGSIRGRSVCWTLATLAARGARTFMINAVADDVSRARRIANRATAKGANTASVAARATITVDPGAAPPRGGGVTG